jgi:hypothetical protein
MKTNLLLPVIIIISFTCTYSQTSSYVNTEKQAVIDLLEEESAGVINVDYERWAATWVHSDKASFLWVAKNYYTLKSDWNEVGTWIKNTMDNIADTEKLEKENYKIHVNGNMAWAIYNEFSYNQDQEFTGKFLITKILEKNNGKWKIIHTTVVNETSYDQKNSR